MSEQNNKKQLESQVDKITAAIFPVVSEFTVGGVFGFCAGYFSRQAAKYAIYATGGTFVLLQVLQSKGYITLNYKNIENDIKNAGDLDGDGKLTTNDVKVGLKRFLAIIGDKIPNAAGFVAAYFLGLSGKIL